MSYLEPPPGPAPVVVVRDVGGYVDHYRAATERYRQENREVRLHECRSACTLALSLPNVCVYPDSLIKFHKAYDERTRISDENVSRELMASYPPAVQARLGQLTRDYRALRGAELIELGIRDCNDKRTIMVAKNTPPAERGGGIAQAMQGLVSAVLNPGETARTGALPTATSQKPTIQLASFTGDPRSNVPLPPIPPASTVIEVPLPPRRPAEIAVLTLALPAGHRILPTIEGALPPLPARFMAYAPLTSIQVDMIERSLR